MSYLGTNKLGKMYLGDTAIGKAYLGSDLVYENAASVEPLDTDGLIAYWNGDDAKVSGKWQDRINNFNIALSTNATRTSDGYYKLNNLSNIKNAWAYMEAAHQSTMNNLIDKEFTCFIECKVKYESADTNACVIDFGTLGAASSTISFYAAIGQAARVHNNCKVNNSSSGYSTRTTPVFGSPTFSLNQYTDLSIKCGVRILSNRKQEVYVEALGAKAYGIIDTPKTVNFQGIGTSKYPFGLGIAYVTASQASAPTYLNEVLYKKILIYNKAK